MEGFSWWQIFAAIGGSAGFITAIIAAFNAVTARLDARKKRIAGGVESKIANAVEVKRLQAETDGKTQDSLVGNLWKIIEAKETEIAKLEKELEQTEQHSSLSRPTITKIYIQLRAMRKEIESLTVMRLDDEQTNVFVRRFEKVKECLDEIEYKLMP